MEKIHIQKKSYDGYCVGTGVEYPNIIVSAKNDDELVTAFKEALPIHIKALKKYKKEQKEIKVIAVEP